MTKHSPETRLQAKRPEFQACSLVFPWMTRQGMFCPRPQFPHLEKRGGPQGYPPVLTRQVFHVLTNKAPRSQKPHSTLFPLASSRLVIQLSLQK